MSDRDTQQPTTSTRRQFLGHVGRAAGALVVGAFAWRLIDRADGEKVWQLDADACTACKAGLYDQPGLNEGHLGLSRCATECVLRISAVKAVNDFDACGYCMICPGYHDVSSPADANNVPLGRVCPYDAIKRRRMNMSEADDPNNDYYEYTIDESKCTGCGKCVIACKPPLGNGSLRLEVRHDSCVDCNQCAIALKCPADAFSRMNLAKAANPKAQPDRRGEGT